MRQPNEWDERLHQRIWELLPWYANGTLEAGERRSVEEHTARCERCREELESCRRLGAVMVRSEEVIPSPHPSQLVRLMARLEQAESSSPGQRLKGLFAVTPKPVRWALAAQLAAVLLLTAGLLWSLKALVSPAGVLGAPAEFRTLSDPVASPAAPAPLTRVRIVFAEDTTERRIREVLLGAGGQMAGGPSPLGAYQIELPAGRDPLPVVLAYLRRQSEVLFAEPITGEEGL